MRGNSSSGPATTDALVLAAAQIAEDLLADCSPCEEAVFTFAASVVEAGRTSDRPAASMAFELASGLLDHVPPGRAWGETHGRLWTTKLVAWMHLQAFGDPEMHVSAQFSGYIRDTLTPGKHSAVVEHDN